MTTVHDPLLALVQAHHQLRKHLHQLIRVGRLIALGRGDFRLVPTLSQAMTFLKKDVLLHARDEEDTLHPRLRAKLRDPQSHFAYLLQHIEDDHAEVAKLHEKLDNAVRELVQRLPLEGHALPEAVEKQLAAFRGIVNELYRIYAGHMLVEERDVFPAIQVIFTPRERAEMAAEMSERRAANGARDPRRAIYS